MKKLAYLLLTVFTIESFGQINLTGSGSPWINGTYQVFTPIIPGGPTCYLNDPSDVGSIIYKKNNSAQGHNFNYQIRRINGYWYIEGLFATNATSTIMFKTKFQQFTTSPPCGVTWIKYSNNSCYDNQTPVTPIAEVNSLLITGNCESCQISSDENHSLVHNFPVGDNATIVNITSSDGLRQGSSFYHCGLKEIVTYDGEYWNNSRGELLFNSQLEISNLGNNIQFLIQNPYPALVENYEIEISNNRSNWSSIGSFSNTTTTINVLSSQYPETAYHFRLKTTYNSHSPQYSCVQKLYKPYSGPIAATLPPPGNCCAAFVSLNEDYIPGTLMSFKANILVPDNTNFWYLRIKDIGGNTIINQNFTPVALLATIQLSSNLFEYNKKYEAEVYNPNWGGSMKNAFYVKQPVEECSF